MTSVYREKVYSVNDFENLSSFNELTQKLLIGRGITSKKEADVFFKKEYVLHDPFLLPDMDKAVARILLAIEQNEKIAIFSDYDCDGIPGGALMYDFFNMIGYSNVQNYIPHRHEEGYGLSVEAVSNMQKEGASVIVTIDCGISDHAAVLSANGLGVDVIVTDHHEPKETLPDAYAVINPKRTDSVYPFDGLCGTGVAFKLICALIAKAGFQLKPGQEKWLLDLVGIATIGDMVPLRDENRVFAHYGLMVFKKGRRSGLAQLCSLLRMPLSSITEDDVGFMIGPRINAASRMGNAYDALTLLTTKNEGEAGAYARKLDRINNERKGIVASMVKEAKRKLGEETKTYTIIVIGDPEWRPSLAGLVANTLAEAHSCPVFVWGRDGNGVLKGSCRSGGTVSVVALMEAARECFEEFGGHHASGGFAIKESMVHTLDQILETECKKLQQEKNEAQQTIEIDAVLRLEDVTAELIKVLKTFAPYGTGNHKPLFLFSRVKPSRVEVFGKQKAHTKVLFNESNKTITGIGFFMLPEEYEISIKEGVAIDLLAHVEESVFMGRTETRLRIVAALTPK